MYRYSFTRFIDFMLNNKRLADFTNLFSPNTIKKNNSFASFAIVSSTTFINLVRSTKKFSRF